MRRIISAFIFLSVAINANAQTYIKIDNGFMLNSLYNNKDLPILSSRGPSYSVLLGIDYLSKKSFYLSSQLGYMKLSSKEKNMLLPGNDFKVSESSNYLHFNTTVRTHIIDKNNMSLFIGLGPYLNYLISSKNFDSSIYSTDYKHSSINIGGKVEIGLTQNINKFRVGIIGSYLRGFTPTSSSEYINLYNNTLSASITVGYRIL